MENMRILLTPAMSKRLIALGLCENESILRRLRKGIVVVCGGTTNGYVAEALLSELGEDIGELKYEMHKGVNLPAGVKTKKADNADVVIIDGKWERELDLPAVVDRMRDGDIIFKGGNAVYPENGEVGVLIGNTVGGTIMNVMKAAYGRRVTVIAPVGLEKRVYLPIADIMEIVNASGMDGERMGLLPAKAYTEIDAIADLTSADATLIAGGGVMGAEGACIFHVLGEKEDITAMREVYEVLKKEENFRQK